MEERCGICGLVIDDIDRMSGRIVDHRNGEAHSYCKDIADGIVPDCPLARSVSPQPCSARCVQARLCDNHPNCLCQCDNMLCQIGQAVRTLRGKGMVPWEGYVPKKMRDSSGG